MDEQGDESWEPATKRARFAKPKTSPERQEAAVGVVPKNTHNSSQWALQNFNTWATNRSSLGHPVPERLLESHDAKLLCKYLSLYVMETRREANIALHFGSYSTPFQIIALYSIYSTGNPFELRWLSTISIIIVLYIVYYNGLISYTGKFLHCQIFKNLLFWEKCHNATPYFLPTWVFCRIFCKILEIVFAKI